MLEGRRQALLFDDRFHLQRADQPVNKKDQPAADDDEIYIFSHGDSARDWLLLAGNSSRTTDWRSVHLQRDAEHGPLRNFDSRHCFAPAKFEFSGTLR